MDKPARGAPRASRSKAVVNMRVGASDARLFRRKGTPSAVGLTPHKMRGPDHVLHLDALVLHVDVNFKAVFRLPLAAILK